MDVESISSLEEQELTLPIKPPRKFKVTKGNQANPEPKERRLVINISGQQFVTTFKTLQKYPKTKLGQLANNKPTVSSYFFESDADVFKEVLKFYANDKLHCPKDVCFSDFIDNLNFWEIDVKHIADCCSHVMKDETELEKQFQFFDRRITLESINSGCFKRCQFYIWAFLTDPCGPDTKWRLGSKIWSLLYLLITFISGMCLAVQTELPAWRFDVVNSTNNTTSLVARQKAANCEEYVKFRRRPELLSMGIINSSFVMFYVAEISVRFLCCPRKSFFWKSIHGLDMVISCLDIVIYGFTAYLFINIVPFTEKFPNADRYCTVTEYLETGMIMVAQMRFVRLLSYASVYR